MSSSSSNQDAGWVQIVGGEAQLRLQSSVYDMRSVMSAAHKFSDRCGIHISHEDESTILVRLTPKAAVVNIHSVALDYSSELLDQVLRQSLRLETEPIRRLLIAQAFSQTNLISSLATADAGTTSTSSQAASER